MADAPVDLASSLARALADAGCAALFGVPGGGSNLDLVGACGDAGLRFVLAHGETAAGIMASTHGLLTGSPSAVVVTRGPGAASVINAAAQATLDRHPLVVVTDCVPERSWGRIEHQRIDQRALFAPVSKASATIGDRNTVNELGALVATAIRWPYGAVHLDYDPATSSPSTPASPPQGVPTSEPPWEPGATLLAASRRPVIIVGAEAAALAAEAVARLADGMVPVLTTYQAIGAVPTESAASAGLYTGGALERPVLATSDLIITIGLDPVEPIPAAWDHPQPVLALTSVPGRTPYVPATVEAVGPLDRLVERLLPALGDNDWVAGEAAAFREDARRRLRPDGAEPATMGPLDVVDVARAAVPAGATVTVDAGAHFLAIMPNWPVAGPRRLLISNGLATMGFAVPAAIGAAVARPGEPVLALTGDGGLSMVLGELETIARYDLPITVVVFDDARLSLIEIKQGTHHGGPGAVRYRPIDYLALGRAVGLDAFVADTAEGLAAVLSDGWERPRLVGARIDPSTYAHLIRVTRG